MIWNVQGTPNQQEIVRAGLARCDFPFERLRTQMQSEAGIQSIPIDWQDLSRYAATEASSVYGEYAHLIERVIEGRRRVLGLAWYSGRVTLDTSLESDPRLAHEVLLAEGAHMVDFFYMTDQHRRAIVNALHQDQVPDNTSIVEGQPLGLDGHECGWFDVGPYEMWVGEAFMESFIESFSDVRVSIQLGHSVSTFQAKYIRRVLLGPALVGTARGRAYHRPTCPFIRPSWVLTPYDWPHPIDAGDAGRRPCRVCRPL